MIDRALKPKGYVGKILRVDLTNKTTAEVDTYQYVPDYIGGKGIAAKIFFDEVPANTGAYDPANELIFMTGPACGTGLPSGGRATFCSISPKPSHDMFTWSGIGGFFGDALKHAGYDGIILQGKADKHTYVVIDDGKVTFEDADADGLWGEFVIETQEKIFDKYGRDFYSFVIGPAGENLLRYASITTSADNAAAKAGFGAVMGSKNLKAVAVRGTGDIEVANIDEVLALRDQVNRVAEIKEPNGIRVAYTYGTPDGAPEGAGQQDPVPGGWSSAWLACCPGCTMRCNKLTLDCTNPLNGEKMNVSTKCVDVNYPVLESDCYYWLGEFIASEVNDQSVGMGFYKDTTDVSDPLIHRVTDVSLGNDMVNYWKFNFDMGNQMSYLCNAYGIDKWEPLIFFRTWLSACRQEGMLEDLPFDLDVPPEDNIEFMKYFFDMVVYRRNKVGDLFAEGMSRMLRAMGKGKWGNSIYHNRWNRRNHTRLDIPVALEMGWGGSVHWLGRGYQSLNEPQALQGALQVMVSSRDSQTNAHQHCTFEEYDLMKDDPYHSPVMAETLYVNDIYGDIKESLLSCEWTHHNPYRSNEEVRMYNAATGYDLTEEEFFECGERVKNVFRALLVRNASRTRDEEAEEIFPIMSFPNSEGWAPTWDDWNDAIDLYYARLGWDQATGWPTRATYERLGMTDVEAVMEAAGKIPDENAPYTRKKSPFTVDGHFKPQDYEPVDLKAVLGDEYVDREEESASKAS